MNNVYYAPFSLQKRIFNYKGHIKGILKVSFYYRVWYTFHYESASISKEFVYLLLCWPKLGGI